MACQPEICALECELSDEDSFDPIPAPIREIITAPRSRRKIMWMKVTEFDSEAEAKIYVGDNWGHLRTNRTKIDQRRSDVFYCRLHGRPGCLTQSKYEHTPGGKFIVFESKDPHNVSLGTRQVGLKESVKAKVREAVKTGHMTAKLLINKLELTMKEELPPIKQLRNFLAYENKSTSNPIVYIRDLKQF